MGLIDAALGTESHATSVTAMTIDGWIVSVDAAHDVFVNGNMVLQGSRTVSATSSSLRATNSSRNSTEIAEETSFHATGAVSTQSHSSITSIRHQPANDSRVPFPAGNISRSSQVLTTPFSAATSSTSLLNNRSATGLGSGVPSGLRASHINASSIGMPQSRSYGMNLETVISQHETQRSVVNRTVSSRYPSSIASQRSSSVRESKTRTIGNYGAQSGSPLGPTGASHHMPEKSLTASNSVAAPLYSLSRWNMTKSTAMHTSGGPTSLAKTASLHPSLNTAIVAGSITKNGGTVSLHQSFNATTVASSIATGDAVGTDPTSILSEQAVSVANSSTTYSGSIMPLPKISIQTASLDSSGTRRVASATPSTSLDSTTSSIGYIDGSVTSQTQLSEPSTSVTASTVGSSDGGWGGGGSGAGIVGGVVGAAAAGAAAGIGGIIGSGGDNFNSGSEEPKDGENNRPTHSLEVEPTSKISRLQQETNQKTTLTSTSFSTSRTETTTPSVSMTNGPSSSILSLPSTTPSRTSATLGSTSTNPGSSTFKGASSSSSAPGACSGCCGTYEYSPTATPSADDADDDGDDGLKKRRLGVDWSKWKRGKGNVDRIKSVVGGCPVSTYTFKPDYPGVCTHGCLSLSSIVHAK